jgi:hypothetical protein
VAKGSSRKNDTRKANRDRRQRLDELRRQQRAAERRKNLLFTGSAIIIAIGLIAGAVIPTYLHDRAKKAKLKTGYQAAPTAAEKVAGCTGVHNDPVSPAAQHVLDKAVDYSKQKYGDTKNGTPPIPPSGGPHSPIPLGDKNRFYDVSTAPRPERAVHNLEHGYVVGWYDAGLPAADVTKLKALAADPTLSTMLFVGWSQGSLPLGKHFVLTSWGRTERCGSVSADVVKSFYRAHVNDKNLAPEVGSGPGPDTCPASQLEVSKPPCSPAQTSPSPSSSSTPTPKHSKKK